MCSHNVYARSSVHFTTYELDFAKLVNFLKMFSVAWTRVHVQRHTCLWSSHRADRAGNEV